MIIPEMLKKRWHMETCIAGMMESASWASDASMAVKVVPMLEPSVRGYILSIVMTPTPTRGVRADVNMLDDWTRMVNNAPISMARYPVPYFPHLPNNTRNVFIRKHFFRTPSIRIINVINDNYV